jgi:hypothetical protein
MGGDHIPIAVGRHQTNNVNRRRRISSPLLTTALLAACGAGCKPREPPKPSLPVSVSPGWTLRKMEASGPPANVPQLGTPPVCWTAYYAGDGDVTVWVCGYRVSAFEAEQRMPSTANEVKFHRGVYLVVVHWDNVPHAAITALVGAIQRSLPDD